MPIMHRLDGLGKARVPSAEAILNSVERIGLGKQVLHRMSRVTILLRRDHLLVTAAVLILVLLWLPVVLIGHSTIIAGQRYWWLRDDAMISMRYARNLVQGVGLVWNPGERVEGYSNFLWTLYMVGVHLLPLPVSQTSLVVLLTNIALAVATIPVMIRLIRILGGGTLATLAALAGYVFSRDVMYWTTEGFETALLMLLLLVATLRVLQEAQSNQPRLTTYLVIATMSLVRADAMILSAPLYAASLFLNKNRKVALIYSVISLLLPIAHEMFRIYYYGDILPNTAYLKTAYWDSRAAAGLGYVVDFAKNYALLIAVAVAGAIFSRQRSPRALLGLGLFYTAYVAYVGGDAFPDFRFFVPVLPLLMVLAFIGIQSLGLRQAPRLAVSMLCLVTLPLIIPGYAAALAPSSADVGNVRIGLLLKQNTPATSTVADSWAGSVFYFSERNGVDFLGKVDRTIAHLPVVSSGIKPGHNKFDYDYSLGVLKPDFVVSSFKLPVVEDSLQQQATGNWAYIGQLYFHPLFREHCLSNPVIADTWRTIFVCDWSLQIVQRESWTELR